VKKVHIVTDSVAHIPEALCHELNIGVVPLPYVLDGVTYYDYDVSPREFYKTLRECKTIPTTSGPPPKLIRDQFEKMGKDGNPVLAITVGKVFSSTNNAANLAKEMLPDMNITILSSDSNSMGLGFQVLAAARASRDGKDLNEILSMLEKLKTSTGVVFAAPHIEYLLRGGRINQIQHFVASLLNLIPIMEIKNSPIKAVERIRNEKNIIPRLLELVNERLDGGKPVRMAVIHADAEARAWELAKQVRDRFAPDELITSELTPVLGIHAGPDSIGIAYSTGH